MSKHRVGIERGSAKRGFEFRGTCPYCGKLSFVWNITKKVGHCWFKCCKESARIVAPPLEYVEKNLDARGISTSHVDKTFTKEQIRLSNQLVKAMPVIAAPTATTMIPYNYMLGKRHVAASDITKLRATYDEISNTIYFPINSCLQSTIYPDAFLEHKIPDPDPTKNFGVKYRIPGWVQKSDGGYCFGIPYLDSQNKALFLCEGVFDILSPGLLGYGIALLGVSLSALLGCWIAKNYSKVFIWLDPGAEAPAHQVYERLK